MKQEAKTQFVRFRATTTEFDALKRAARERGMTLSGMIRRALEAFLNKSEEQNERH